MKKVLKPGVFDMFHVGHLNSIKEAAKNGDHLVVAVQDDREVEKAKQEKPIIPLHQRMEILSSLKCVDEVISYRNPDLSSILDFLSIDALCVGDNYGNDDEFPNQKKTLQFCKESKIKVVKTPRTKGVSSSDIKRCVSKFWKSRKKEKNKPIESSTMLGSCDGDEQKLKSETEKEINFMKPYLNKYFDVLDLGSGYGRLSIPMAEYSNKVHAVDFSDLFINILKEKNIQNIVAECYDIVDYTPDQNFDTVIMSGLFPCLDDEQIETIIKKSFDHVKQNGYLIIRTSVGTEERINVINQYSETLNALYTAFYRTEQEIDTLIKKIGFKKLERKDMYDNHEDTKIIMSCFKKI